jgi:hypothetical protein
MIRAKAGRHVAPLVHIIMIRAKAGRHVAPLVHIIMIRAKQSLFFLLNDACLAERPQIPIVLSLVI